jgi:hypothetical protein
VTDFRATKRYVIPKARFRLLHFLRRGHQLVYEHTRTGDGTCWVSLECSRADCHWRLASTAFPPKAGERSELAQAHARDSLQSWPCPCGFARIGPFCDRCGWDGNRLGVFADHPLATEPRGQSAPGAGLGNPVDEPPGPTLLSYFGGAETVGPTLKDHPLADGGLRCPCGLTTHSAIYPAFCEGLPAPPATSRTNQAPPRLSGTGPSTPSMPVEPGQTPAPASEKAHDQGERDPSDSDGPPSRLR